MKKISYCLLAVLIALLAGCATPLTLEQDGDRYAHIIGQEKATIEFISLCDYAISYPSTETAHSALGAFIMTPDSIVLVPDAKPDGSKVEPLVLKDEDIKGIALKSYGLNRQFHIQLDDAFILLQLTRNRQRVDRKSSDMVFGKLMDRGIPELSGTEFKLPKTRIVVIPIPLP